MMDRLDRLAFALWLTAAAVALWLVVPVLRGFDLSNLNCLQP